MPTVEELEAQLAAAKEAEAEKVQETAKEPILTQIKNAGEPDTPFIEKLRTVAGNLSETGQLVEGDLVTAAEQAPVLATLVKAVGELIKAV